MTVSANQHDSTIKRTRAEAALRESEARYKSIVESSHDMIMLTLPDATISYLSPAARSVIGHNPDDLVGTRQSIVHPEDRVRVDASLEAALSAESGSDFEYRILTSAGEIKWVSHSWSPIVEDGKLRMVVSVVRDVTERRQADEALRKDEELLRTLFANIPGAVFRCASDDHWTMEFLSDGIRDLSGYPASDFIGNRVRTYASVVHPADIEVVAEAVGTSVTAREPYVVEYRINHLDGNIRWVQEKGQAIVGPDGNVMWLDGVIIDVTQHKIADEALRKAHDDLSRAYELQREFLNNVTHEVRTPLTAVQGYVRMLLEGVVGPVTEEQASVLGKVIASSDHLLELVTRVLEIAHLKTGGDVLRARACNPLQIVYHAVSSIMPQAARKNVSVRVNGPEKQPLGMYDEGKFAIIIGNLLSNAVKFTERGGITVDTICHTKGTEVVIADTGMGISRSDLPNVFDEFRQLDYPGKHKPDGFGVGLSLVAETLDIVGGSLVISSEQDVGTAVTVFVPTLDGC